MLPTTAGWKSILKLLYQESKRGKAVSGSGIALGTVLTYVFLGLKRCAQIIGPDPTAILRLRIRAEGEIQWLASLPIA
jgi:hypothetical protein